MHRWGIVRKLIGKISASYPEFSLGDSRCEKSEMFWKRNRAAGFVNSR